MDNWRETTTKAGRTAGILAVVAGLVGAGSLVVYWVLPYISISLTGIHIVDSGSLSAENAPIAMFWATVVGILSLLTGYVVWRSHLKVLWVLAVIVPVLTVLGLFSIGRFIAPFALFLVISAILLTVGGRGGVPTKEALSL